jgi:hypothetical protein
VPRPAIGREVPSAVRTRTRRGRGRREEREEESGDMWKETPESRTHEDIPDCVEEPAIEAAVPIEAELEEARRH